ncbi:MAG: stalk domain-containing protein [Clostridia bacterium]|nr:stalk domain-containing protein [Clostridia bacterium]
MRKNVLLILCMILLLCSIHITYASSYVMHTIEPGDTYWKVAEAHNQDIHSLMAMNYSPEDNLIQGQLLKVQTLPTISIDVDGSQIYPDQTPYLENNRAFVPIRFVAEALSVDDIHWDKNSKTAILKKDNLDIRLPYQSNQAYINGSPFDLDAPIHIIEGRIYVPIRFVAEAFNCKVDWDGSNYNISIHTTLENQIIEPDEVYWLSRIVEAEAGWEPYEGKLAVANVVLNRVNSIEFPNTIYTVIFDGYQFTPVLDGTIYNTPSPESIRAATEALEGNNNISSCLYFLNPRKSTNFWIVYNRTFYKTINLHDFYL